MVPDKVIRDWVFHCIVKWTELNGVPSVALADLDKILQQQTVLLFSYELRLFPFLAAILVVERQL